MKDKQIAPPSAEPRIFLVSDILHCVSMTVIVYLRSSFGFAYLRPKSIFLAFSWAFTLYVIYAWTDGEAWHRYRAGLIFGSITVLLYSFHLAVAFIREWRGGGEADQYSGRSWIMRLQSRDGYSSAVSDEEFLHLWGEPAIVFVAAILVALICGSQVLTRWLLLAAACLWAKAALNHWFRVRQGKRQRDVLGDMAEGIEIPENNVEVNTPMSARKPRVERIRHRALPRSHSND